MSEESIDSKQFKSCNNGPKHWNWKGGRKRHKFGYVMIYCPNHPRAINYPYVFEHILVMEKHLGRYLNDNEVVHHRNGIKDQNALSNLCLMTKTEHARHHIKGNNYAQGNDYRLGQHIDTSDRECFKCGSKTTYIHKPNGNNKTPYPVWFHLYNDKENWYCSKCRDRARTARGERRKSATNGVT